MEDREALYRVMNNYLEDHNAVSQAQMKLVLFLNAIEHVARVSRVINQANGNALLVGVGHLWAHRGDAGDATLPPAFHALLDTVKNYG